MSSKNEFLLLDVVSTSCAIHRLQKGFVKKDPFDDRTSNSDLLYRHFFSDEKVNVNKKDRDTAEEVVAYLKGLGFKAIERSLTDFEKKVLQFVTSDTIGRDRLGIAASLPQVYYSKVKSDDWSDRERSLGVSSDFQGSPGSRCNFDIKVEFVKFIPTTNSYLVTSSIDNKHILKFFTPEKKFSVGKKYSVAGFVKPHALNSYTNFKETMINRVKINA